MTDTAIPTDFDTWLAGLRVRALDAQIRAEVFDAAVQGLAPLPGVLDKQAAQPENALSLADYMARVLPEPRIRKARAAMRTHRDLLLEIEHAYRVEPQIVVAIWAIETDLGRIRGDTPVIAALATLAWRGRRAAFFEAELLAALRLVQLGAIAPGAMRGSWAGAMGHGQFMPSSALEFAVDFDGDGRADIWGDDPADGLASIANYLAKHIWRRGQPWALQVVVPEEMDLGATGADQVRPVSYWLDLGVRLPDGSRPADYGPSSLLLPGGAAGPAFLAFRNFHVLTRYNNATVYAIAVGLMADRLAGARDPKIAWPDEPPLTRREMLMLQEALDAAGFRVGGADGLMGPRTARALRAWQAARGRPADGHPDRSALTALTTAPDRRG